jgi:2-succinyl-6-hydroxy-2,4-cyclohexadiene-1-carboxylate synthase
LTTKHVTFLHGFTQTGSSWSPVLQLMKAEFSSQCLDAPGHGANIDGSRTLPQCADDIAAAMEPGILIGYSMGARMALHVALQHPTMVSQLVLISGTPGLVTEEERTARRKSDNELADRIEEIGTASFIDEWLALPIFSGLTMDTNQKDDRLRNTAKGLADSLRCAGTGTQESLWPHLRQLSIPTHLIVGGTDAKFTAIAHDMKPLLQSGKTTVVPSVGHTVHLEDPTTVSQLLDSIILRND